MHFQGFDWLRGHGEPLYHTRERATIKLCSGCFCKAKLARYSTISYCFNKTIIPLALVGYEMIIANSALHASLAIYHLISNA